MTTTPGLVEWFAPGDRARVEEVLADARALGVRRLRTGLAWADWQRDGGPEWVQWLLTRLAREVDVLPVLRTAAPRLGDGAPGLLPHVNGETFGGFVAQVATRHGALVEAMELRPFAGDAPDWQRGDDRISTVELVEAARAIARAGLRVALGVGPYEPQKLGMAIERAGVERVDAVCLSAFPDEEPSPWRGWHEWSDKVRVLLQRHFCDAEIWTVTGSSTAGVADARLAEALLSAAGAPVDRVYWYGGAPKLLHRLWSEGGLGQVGFPEGMVTP